MYNFKNMSIFPGFHGSKNIHGQYMHVSNDVALCLGYKSPRHFMEHSRTDYDAKTPVIEMADLLTVEDKEIISSGNSIKKICFYRYHSDKVSILIGEKFPLYKKQKIYGVGFNYVDLTKTELNAVTMRLFLNVLQNQGVKYQSSYYIKENFDNKIFTDRESECLYFIIRGKSCNEISKILKISQRTVEVYIDKLKEKLQCLKKAELIEKSLDLGYYYIIPESIIKMV